MKSSGLILLIIFFASFDVKKIESARILALFPLNVRSHAVMFQVLMKELAARGHQVDVVSHYPQSYKIPNYRDLSVEGSIPVVEESYLVADNSTMLYYFNTFNYFWSYNVDICKTIFEHSTVQNLLKSKQNYDLVITEIFGVDCFLGFGYKYQAPIINLMSSILFPWSNDRVGNPDNPSYITNYFLPFTDRMNYFERLYNTLFVYGTKIGSYIFADLPSDRLARRYFGEDLPPLSQLKEDVSLILVNSHFSLNQPRPMIPAVIEVGGLHIQKLGKLPKDIETLLNESPHGVVYFSLGTILKIGTIPKEKLEAILETFRELPQRVLWKCDVDAIPNLPSNVKTAKWMPQLEILSHPNVRAFITHGGLMGTQEAVYFGVPMVGIPLFADQYQNVQNYKTRGLAVVLDAQNLTKESMLEALKTVIEDPRYRENAQRHSRLFRDRPMSALDTAIFWTEYVIKHGGAPHLRSAAADLPLYQYLLLDVIGFILFIAISASVVLVFIVRNILCRRRKKITNNQLRSNTRKQKRN